MNNASGIRFTIATLALLAMGAAGFGASPALLPPLPPAGLVATGGNATVGLTWTPSAGAVSYVVRRSIALAGPFATIASGVPVAAFADNTVVNGTTYYYVVRAVNVDGQSGNSATVSATPTSGVAAPGQATGLVATPGNSQAVLSWTATPTAASYVLRRSTVSGGPYATVLSGIVPTSATNLGLTNGTTYFYVVAAVNGGGTGPDSVEAAVTPSAPAAAPTGLIATGGNGQVSLSWTASVTPGVNGYRVKRATVSGGPYALIATLGAVTAHLDTPATNGTTYFYVVTALIGGGSESANSNQASATPSGPGVPPGAPAALTATPGNARVVLSWTPVGGASTYTVKRSPTAGGPYAVVAAGLAGFSYTNMGLSNGTTYFFVVTASSAGGGEGPASPEASATPAGPPPPPASVTAVPGTKQVLVSWAASPGATSYNVRRSTVSGGPYMTVATGVVGLSFLNTGLAGGTTYFYVVRAVNAGGQSGDSPESNATPPTNNPPVATPEGYGVAEEGTLSVVAPGVLGNDTDSDIPVQPLTAVLFGAGTSNGVLTLNLNGSFSYTPAANYAGPDSFQYRAFDGTAYSNVVTVSITVSPVNDPPAIDAILAQGGFEDQAGAVPLTGIGAGGGADENGQTVVVSATSSDPLIVPNPTVTGTGATRSLNFQSVLNQSGVVTITVTANDGQALNNLTVRTFQLTITPVNDAPSFTKGPDQAVNENAPAQSVPGWATGLSAGPADEAGQLLDFVVSNNNNPLFAVQPAVSPAGTLTYTPAANVSGSAVVTVQIHDDGGVANGGANISGFQTFNITVNFVNQVPSFTKGADDTVLEDAAARTIVGWATALSAGPASESGQAVNFIVGNNNNALFSAQPAVSPNGTLTYTVAANANGTATVSVQIHDDGGVANGGVDTSAAQTFVITVTPVNDVPSFTKGADVVVNEGAPAQSIPAWATGLLAGPADEVGQTLSFLVSNDNGLLFSVAPAVSPTGTLTFTPAATAFGFATVTVQIQDNGGVLNGGVDTSAAQTFTITINGVNNVPSFTAGGNQTVNEDAGPQSVSTWATSISKGPANESSQVVDFIVSNNNNGLFTAGGQPAVGPTGTLTFTSAPDANGSATVSVQIHDNGGTADGGVDTSATQTFTITVNPVNDVPSFAVGPDRVVNQNAGAQSFPGSATGISAGPANESGQTVSFLVGNDNNALFSAQPVINASGTLTFTAAVNASGVALVSVQAQDNGGTALGGVDTSGVQTFFITVNFVNQVPSFTKGPDVGVPQNSGAHVSNPWATLISPGPASEAGQALDFIVGNDNNALFSVQPAVSPTGVLTFTPALNQVGSATVTVALHDDGGVLNGGVDTSAQQTFVVTVTFVNQTPSFAKGPDQTVLEDSGTKTVLAWASSISPGPAGEAGQLVDFILGNNNTGLFTAGGQPAVSPTGTLTFTPAPNANGTATVTVQIHDNGGTANGAVDTSAAQSFVINVTPVNDPPVATGDVYNGFQDTPLVIGAPGVLLNDSDVDANPLQALVVLTTTSGTLSLALDGSFTYTPGAGFVGDDSFTYKANDGLADSNVVTVTIHVLSVIPPAPTALTARMRNYTRPTLVYWPLDGSGTDALLNGRDLNVVGTASFAPGLFGQALSLDGTGTGYAEMAFNDPAFEFNIEHFTIQAWVNYANTSGEQVLMEKFTGGGGPGWTLTKLAGNAYQFYVGGGISLTSPPQAITPGTWNHIAVVRSHFEYRLYFNGVRIATGFDSNLVIPTGDKVLIGRRNLAGGVLATNGLIDEVAVWYQSVGSTDAVSDLGIANLYNSGNGVGLASTLVPGVVLNWPAAPGATSYNIYGSNVPGGPYGLVTATTGTSVPVAMNYATQTFFVVRAANVGGESGDSPEAMARTVPFTANLTATPGDNRVDLSFGISHFAGEVPCDFEIRRWNQALTSYDILATVTGVPVGANAYADLTALNGVNYYYQVTGINGSGERGSESRRADAMPANAAPIGVNDSYNTAEDTPLIVSAAAGVLSNDVDTDPLTAILDTAPTGAQSFTLNPDGSFSYTPLLNFNGTDSFKYFANDGTSNSVLLTVTINVAPVNDPPVAGNISYGDLFESTPYNKSQPGVLGNASDVDLDVLTAQLVTGPSHAASFTLNPDGSFSYTPVFRYYGPDSFTFQAFDGTALSNIATINLTIQPVMDTILNNDSYGTNENVPLVVNALTGVLANDVDPDGDTLTASLVVGPSLGGITFNADGSFTYTPFGETGGVDTFTYRIFDGALFSPGTATVTITITGVNDPPTVTVPGTQQINQDNNLTFNGNVSIGDVDAGGSPVAMTISTSNGTLTLAAGGGLSFTVGDGAADPTMTFTGTVSAINARLNGMVFAPAAGFAGVVTISGNVNDQGNSGTGGPLSTPFSFQVNVLPAPPSGLTARGIDATRINLAGYWEFENNGFDGSGNGRDLTVFGPLYAGGKFGQALSMNGAATTFGRRPGADSAFDLVTGDFTVQTWVNFASTTGTQVLIEKFDGASGGWTLLQQGGTQISFQAQGIATVPVTQVITGGQWHQVIVRRRGFEYQIFFDGAGVSPAAVQTGSIIASAVPLVVGRRDLGAGFGLNGRIDEAAIWTRGLSNEEIADLYSAGAGYRVAELTNNPHIALAWTSPAPGFEVYRSTSSGGGYGLIDGAVPTATFKDEAILSETPYFYVVKAVASGLQSLNSNEASGLIVPHAPAGLSATPGSTTIQLSWPTSQGANQYRLRTFTTGQLSYTDELFAVPGTMKTGLTNGQAYFFQVSAIGPNGESATSPNPQLQAAPGFMPGAPTLTATPGGSRVALSWTPVGGATGYTVRFGPTSGGNYSNNLFLGNQTDTVVTVTEALVWYFVVSAQSADGINGPNSNEVTSIPQGFAGPDVATSPYNGQANVPLASNFVYTFTQAMDHATTEAAINITRQPAGAVPKTAFWSTDSRTLTLVPVGSAPGDLLMEGATYTFTLGTGARTQSGINVDLPVVTRFTTRLDNTPAQVVTMLTNGGQDPRTQTLTGPVTTITVTFNEPMNTADQNGNNGGPARVELRSVAVELEAQVGQPNNGVSLAWISNTTLVATFAPALPENVLYRLRFDNANDLAGNWSNNQNDIAMVIGRSTPDLVAPTLTGTVPKAGSTNVSRDTGVFLSISEPLSKASLGAVSVTENLAPATTPYDIDFNEDPPGIFVGPRRAWPANTQIRIVIAAGAADTTGNPLAPQTILFTTAAAGAADAAPFVLDQPYSSFQVSTNSASPVLNSDSSGFILFKNSVSNLRDYIDRSTFSTNDVSITEFATGIPVKGYNLELDDNGNVSGFRVSWNGWYGLNTDTVFAVTMNASLQNSRGVGIVPVTYFFRTTPSGGNGVPYFHRQPETRLQSYPTGPATMAVEAELRADVQDNGPTEVLTVSVQDLGDTAFVVGDNSGGPSNSYNFEYSSNGNPEADLTSTGPHVLQYTVSDAFGHAVSVRSNAYIFPLASIPTLAGPSGAILTQTPTYTWSLAGSDAQAIILHVFDQNADLHVFETLLAPDTVTFTQPADQPLPPGGNYAWAIEILKWENGNLGNELGVAFTMQTFSVPGTVLPPARLAATGGYGQVQLTWPGTAGASGGFKIYRSPVNNTSYSLLQTVSADQTSFTDLAVLNNTLYFYKLTTMGATESAFSNEVSATPIATPSSPVLTLTEVNGQVNAGWTAVSGVPSYTLWRQDPINGFQTVATLVGTSFLDSPPVDGSSTFTYYVSTVNALGQNLTSSQVGIIPKLPPSGLNATPAGAGVFLSWPTVSGATSYSLFRSTTSGLYGAALVTQPGSSFLDSTIPGGVPHFYVVSAQVPVGTTGRSPEATATIVVVPGVPTGVAATPGNQQVGVSWTAVGGATSYWVKRASGASPGSFARIANPAGTSFTDLGLPSGQQYWYVVSAVSTGGESLDSSPAQTATPTGPAIRVTDLLAAGGNTIVQLNWTNVQNAGNGYNIYRSTTSGSGYVQIATNFAPGVGMGQIATFTDTGRTNNTTYFYVMRSVNGFGEAADSNEAAGTPQPAPGAPVLSRTEGNQQIQLNWTVAAGATSYEIYRRVSASGAYPGFFYLGNLTGTTYTDINLTNGTSYFYAVAAVASTINKTPSNEVSGVPFVPANPTVLSTSPFDTQTNVSPATHFVVTFSELMNPATLNNTNITITPATLNPIVFFPGVPNTNSVTLVFDTVAPPGAFADDLLQTLTPYTVHIGTGCQSQASGLGLLSQVDKTFTTFGDITPPQLTQINTNPGNVNARTTVVPAATTTTVEFTFSEQMNNSSGSIRLRDRATDQEWQASIGGGGSPPGTSLAWNGGATKLTMTLGTSLSQNTIYEVDFNGPLFDVAGNALPSFDDNSVALVTARSPGDVTRPTFVDTIPVPGTVSREFWFFAVASEPLSPDAVSFITVTENGGAPSVPFTVEYGNDPPGLGIHPLKSWPAGATIVITIGTGVKDTSGNNLLAAQVYTYTTAAASGPDGDAIEFDEPYSVFKNGLNDINPNGAFSSSSGNTLFALSFRNSTTLAPAAVNAALLSANNITIVDPATGLPLKGTLLSSRDDRGRVEIGGGRAFMGLSASKTYQLKINPTFLSSFGVASAPVTYTFQTAAVGGPFRPTPESIDAEYIAFPGSPTEADLRTRLSTFGPPGLPLQITVTDSPDSAFTVTQPAVPGPTQDLDFQFDNPVPALTTLGAHDLTFTFKDGNAGHDLPVKQALFLFGNTGLPSATGPAAISTNHTPTYSWAAPFAGVDAHFVFVQDSSNNQVLFRFLGPNTTSTAHPSDYPLPAGDYTVIFGGVKFASAASGQSSGRVANVFNFHIDP